MGGEVPRGVDNLSLMRWREVDASVVLERLGCYLKADPTFQPTSALGTRRFHVNADGVEFELLLTGPKFFDARAQRGGGGAIDLVMHLYDLDFKAAVRRLRNIA